MIFLAIVQTAKKAGLVKPEAMELVEAAFRRATALHSLMGSHDVLVIRPALEMPAQSEGGATQVRLIKDLQI